MMATAVSQTGEEFSERLMNLLSEMTLEDKLGQINMPYPGLSGETDDAVQQPTTRDDVEALIRGSFHSALGPIGGFFQAVGLVDGDPAAQAEFHNDLQREAAKSGLGIPLLQIAEGTHGVIASYATIFPEGPTLGASWNLDLVRRVYKAVAAEARALGIHLLCTLLAEPIRDPRLGRNCEAYTEDPYFAGEIARAIVDGAQGESLADPHSAGVVLCHYPGQSQPESGLERGAMHISERDLRSIFLPPWERGLSGDGAIAVMATYPAIDGQPAHASETLLTTILRNELGFDGIVLSEGLGFETLIYEGVAADQKEAGQKALAAGVDVNITYEQAYLGPLRESVLEGAVPAELLDRAVLRVLHVKERLGLLDGTPLTDPSHAAELVHCTEHADLALQAAREGIVVLRNREGLLPLDPQTGTVAVIGPNADAAANQLGDYTVVSHGGVTPEIITTLAGIRALVGQKTNVVYAEGCSVLGEDAQGIEAAKAAAASADVAVVVVGEQQGSFHAPDPTRRPSVGEGADVASLDLTGRQLDLAKAVTETGTPTVVVLINGRALSIPWIDEHAGAVVEAWLPGEAGGRAIAEVLFGATEPSGRLPVTIPRHVGQLPVHYNHEIAKDYASGIAQRYVDMPASPLYPFGHGLSYTTFSYSDVTGAVPSDGGDGVEITAHILNTGQRDGYEVVQIYVKDIVASFTPKAMKLRAFQKLHINAGQLAEVTLRLRIRDFQTLDASLKPVIEPGLFEVLVGSSSADIHAVIPVKTVLDAEGTLGFEVVDSPRAAQPRP